MVPLVGLTRTPRRTLLWLVLPQTPGAGLWSVLPLTSLGRFSLWAVLAAGSSGLGAFVGAAADMPGRGASGACPAASACCVDVPLVSV